MCTSGSWRADAELELNELLPALCRSGVIQVLLMYVLVMSCMSVRLGDMYLPWFANLPSQRLVFEIYCSRPRPRPRRGTIGSYDRSFRPGGSVVPRAQGTEPNAASSIAGGCSRERQSRCRAATAHQSHQVHRNQNLLAAFQYCLLNYYGPSRCCAAVARISCHVERISGMPHATVL